MMNSRFGSSHVLLLVAVFASAAFLSACRQKETPAIEQEIDFSQAKEVFNMPSPPQAAPVDPSTVVAVINETEITQGEIDKEIMSMLARSPASHPPERIAQMREQMTSRVIDTLIVKNLLQQAVDSEDTQVTEEEMQEGLDRINASLPPDVKLEEHLAKTDMTMDDLHDAVKIDLRVNKLLMSKFESIEEPSDAEVTAYYEENKEHFAQPESVSASHILITVKPDDDEETKTAKKVKAEDIYQKLVDGAVFEELALAESDCPSSERGGSLGTFGRGQMVPPFEEAAFTQEIGAIGDVVETRFGYHVIRVDERTEPRTIPLEEARDRIAQGLQAQSRQMAIKEYIDTLKAKAEIIYPQS